MSARCVRRPNLLLGLPVVFSGAVFLSSLPSAAPAAAPDPLNPAFEATEGAFEPQLPGGDQSQAPSPAYTEDQRRQLIEEGRELFFSRTTWGQRPSRGPMVRGQVLSCASCHVPPSFSDSLTHLVGPVGERPLARRQTPSLLGAAATGPFGWDGRNPTLQHQSRGAIVSPLEMNAAREPTKRELDALMEFQKTLTAPPPVPGRDYDPERAARGETLFRTPRPVTDPTGEFPGGAKVACATCHAGRFFTDGKPHRHMVVTGDPLFDPGEVGKDGSIAGFHTPSLLGARLTSPYFHDGSMGDPTQPDNLLSGGVGPRSLEGEIGAVGPSAARRALLDNLLPFYNTVRFNFLFTEEELKDLAEYILSL
ncbi:MAG: cytochrome c peroxidase [Acidimicrobiia bacterium]